MPDPNPASKPLVGTTTATTTDPTTASPEKRS